ncbi:hypothetical protein [Segatella baroniae]|uniref:hypothetical protein n=1 Tax=Segatella baroniae TaxID=305719 RepID=UPI00068888DB|nr:hypothetical protein [Segatella baroniae]
MKKIIRILLIILFLLAGLLLAVSHYMLGYSLQPSNNRGRRINYCYHRMRQQYPEMKPWLDSLRRNGGWKDVWLTRPGGRYHALRVDAPHPTNRVAILVHGYTDSISPCL